MIDNNMQQISIFDICKEAGIEIEEIGEEENSFVSIGQHVWKVDLLDKKEFVITSFFEVHSSNERRYIGHLVSETEDRTTIVGKEMIGSTIYLSEAEADEAIKNLKETHEEDILTPEYFQSKTIKDSARYAYIRKCDGRVMNAYIILFDDDSAYMKGDMTFRHYKKFSSQKELDKYIEKNIVPGEDIDYQVLSMKAFTGFETLYRCKDSSDWDYCEKGCSHVSLYDSPYSKVGQEGEEYDEQLTGSN